MSNETSNLKARMRSSEHRLSEHDEKINVLEKNCAQVTENLKTLGADMHTVKGGVKKLVDHVTGTNLG